MEVITCNVSYYRFRCGSGDYMDEQRDYHGLVRVRVVTDKECVLSIVVFHDIGCENGCCPITWITESGETVEERIKI